VRTNCLVKHVTEGRIEGKRTWGIRRKLLLDDLKKKRGYWKLKL
jgi:hypothetical protein